MGLDIRIPIGLMFVIVSVILIIYGLTSSPAIYARSLGININLLWGSVLLLFGSVMLIFGLRKSNKQVAGGEHASERDSTTHNN